MSTIIGPITPRIVASYRQSGLAYTFNGVLDDVTQSDELWELCWGAEQETGGEHIQGTRLYAVDYTLSQRYVVYIQFPAAVRPRPGWYIIRNCRTFMNETPLGLEWAFTLTVTFLGTPATLQDGFKLIDTEVKRNDWFI